MGGSHREGQGSRAEEGSRHHSSHRRSHGHRHRRSPSDDEDRDEAVRRLARKEAAKLEKSLKADTVAGYSNAANPFGDEKLTERSAHSLPCESSS